MARMIPIQLPPDTTSMAEAILFDCLAEGLDSSFTVIHSLSWLDDCHKQGECDFVVLHPALGLLVIEAKSGEVAYDGTTRTWSYSDAKRLSKDPFRQAQAGAHFLNHHLCERVPEWRSAGLPFGYAVALPQAAALEGTTPPHVSDDLLILRPHLDDLQERINDIQRQWRAPSAKPNDGVLKKAVDALCGSFRIVPTLVSKVEAQREKLIRLTERQLQTLDILRVNRRMLVKGCAGSGKTILVLEDARQLADDGAKVLLLCYNIPLGAALKRRAEELGTGIDVFHFHGLCAHVCKACGVEYPDEPDDPVEFYRWTAPELLLEALDEYEVRYDAVLVDEAQDFAEEWWVAIERLLRDPKASFFHVFVDQDQDIFGRCGDLPFEEPVAPLLMNYRNSASVASFARQLIGGGSHPDAVAAEGPEPRLQEVADDDAEREAVRKELHRLVHDEKLRPDQIVILGHHRFEHSAFAAHPQLGNLTVVDRVDSFEPNQIRYATIHRFKGLEADCVMVTGPDKGGWAKTDEDRLALMYVAATRALSMLCVFYRSDSAMRRCLGRT